MKIVEFLKETFIDYPPEKIASIVFVAGCNFRCPGCYSKHIVDGNANYSEDEIFSYLDSRKGWIEGVVLCGGEPTLQLNLADFARKVKERGLAVKLDTNGSQYSVLQELKKEGLVDYVAMDVKAPPEIYSQVVGKDYIDLRDDIEKGMAITNQFPDYEFRTTVVPVDRGNGIISFMTVEEVVDITKWIRERTGSNEHKYILQPFVPQEESLIDPRFAEFPETSKELLEEMKDAARGYLPNCKTR